MSLRRAFLLGAAALASVAALVAIATALNGDFGETEGKIFATLATTFAAGSAVVAGLALLARRESAVLGYAGIGLALTGFVLWSAQIWGDFADHGYWKLVGVLTAWSLAVLIVTTTRLMLSSPSLVRALYPATGAATGGAALVATVMILRESGDGALRRVVDPGVARRRARADPRTIRRLSGTARRTAAGRRRRRRGDRGERGQRSAGAGRRRERVPGCGRKHRRARTLVSADLRPARSLPPAGQATEPRCSAEDPAAEALRSLGATPVVRRRELVVEL